ncbi:hypothetical protein AB6A40_000729 [Gnathostoma spinigerum]|uniref:SSD domain-containing protein n=1 Tax=Gnathostoma spinigerum TaxID=75299 RepID=A0ABD6E3N3_9BILA
MINEADRDHKPPLESVIIDHPKSTIYGYNYSVVQHLFGIQRYSTLRESNHPNTSSVSSLKKSSEIDLASSSSESGYPTGYGNRLKHVSVVMLAFYSLAPDTNLTKIVTKWELAVFDWAVNGASNFPDLIIDVLGDKVLGNEMIRGGLSLVPHLIAGLSLSISFVMISVVFSSDKHRRFSYDNVLIVVGIMASPLLSVLTTFGIMGVAQVDIYPIHMVIPFLILAIGADDAFLMLHAWNHILPSYDHLNRSEKKKKIPFIFGQVLEEVGPSILITSLTNAVAFGVGTTVATPALQLFCLTAALAMVLDFIFELTLFGSLLTLAAHIRLTFEGPVVNWNVKNSMVQMPEKLPKPTTKILRRMLRAYSYALTTTPIRILVFAFTALFFVVSLWGTLRMRTYINAQKIIPSDSLLQRTDEVFRKYQWPEYEPVQVFVNNPPDIKDRQAVAELKALIHDFETLPHAIGPKATMFWMSDFEKMIEDINELTMRFGIEVDPSYQSLPEFLRTFSYWNETIRWQRDENGTVKVTAFYFITGYGNSTTWLQRANMMLSWREAAKRWSKFNVTIYSENSPVFEGVFSLKATTVQTATITLVCMLVVCLLFVPSAAGVITAGWAICSISLGVLGFLSWWGLDLDPITLSAIIMSIGFSVDYTAHVSYHYQRARQLLPPQCTNGDHLLYTLDSIGWPMIEAAISTLICFVPAVFHSDYTPSVFVRTITLVVAWGVLHGLLLLPTILAAIPDCMFVEIKAAPHDLLTNSDCSLLLLKQRSISPPPNGEVSIEKPSTVEASETVDETASCKDRSASSQLHVATGSDHSIGDDLLSNSASTVILLSSKSITGE